MASLTLADGWRASVATFAVFLVPARSAGSRAQIRAQIRSRDLLIPTSLKVRVLGAVRLPRGRVGKVSAAAEMKRLAAGGPALASLAGKSASPGARCVVNPGRCHWGFHD